LQGLPGASLLGAKIPAHLVRSYRQLLQQPAVGAIRATPAFISTLAVFICSDMSDLARNLIRLTRPLARQGNRKLARDFGEDPESLQEIKRYLKLGDSVLGKKRRFREQRLLMMPDPAKRQAA